MSALGIIAGGGELPLAIAESASRAGRPVYLAALLGSADPEIAHYPHDWVSVGEAGRMLNLLRQHGCGDVILAGRVSRPKWSDLKVDAKGVLKLPKVVAAAARGDDALLRSFVDILESEGFRAVGVAEAAPDLVAEIGVLGARHPSRDDEADIALGIKIARALGALDVGQAAVACRGLVLTVEAAEGTDAMIARVGTLPENIRGTAANRRGVLVKARKPIQDGRTDLPVIGRHTVAGAASVGLAGIAVEAGASLILNKPAVADAANQAGLFVLGFPAQSS
jgi:hypothetical protein